MLSGTAPTRSLVGHAAEAHREYQWMKGGLVLALALACAGPLALNLVDPDLWGHVKYGEDWLAEGQLPRTATHTFTAAGHPWINHENIAELALALGYRHVGTTGLLVAKCLWGMSILALMACVAHRRGAHVFVSLALLLVVATNLQPFFPLRPQLLSFGLCAVTLMVLDRAFATWREDRQVHWPWLCLLPLVVVVWANSHGGFVAGLCIIGAYLGGRIVEVLVRPQPIAWRTACGLAAVGLACLAATFANPYGWHLHQWLAASLAQPRPEITEWLPPRPHDPTFWPWLGLLSIATASLVATRRRRDWVEVVILLLVAWQSALHLRHIAFLSLLCGFWLPAHLQSALGRLRPRDAKLPVMRLSPWMRRVVAAVLVVSVGLQSYALGRKLTELPVERNFYPVDAIQFMSDCGLKGKLVVSFNWAQFVLAALPKMRVAFDGRYDTCYPLEVVDMHFDFLLGENGGERYRGPNSGPIDPTRVLEFGSPDLVLVDRRYEHPVAVMKAQALKQDAEWVALYCDRVAELWGRASKYSDPRSPDYFPLAARVRDAGPREGAVAWPAFPLRAEDFELTDVRHVTPATRWVAAMGVNEHGDD